MESQANSGYTPSLSDGTRVWLVREGHPQTSQAASVIGVLPNPSRRREHQWYDVQFDSGIYGRFLERYLLQVESQPDAKTG